MARAPTKDAHATGARLPLSRRKRSSNRASAGTSACPQIIQCGFGLAPNSRYRGKQERQAGQARVLLIVPLSSLDGLQRHARIHDEALVSRVRRPRPHTGHRHLTATGPPPATPRREEATDARALAGAKVEYRRERRVQEIAAGLLGQPSSLTFRLSCERLSASNVAPRITVHAAARPLSSSLVPRSPPVGRHAGQPSM